MTAIDRVMYDFMYRFSKPRWDDDSIAPQVAQLAFHEGPTRNAIDLGCGTGTYSIFLAQQGFSVVGVDISQTAIRKARQKSSRTQVRPEFITHDVAHLEFLSGPFDIALDVGCFHALNAAVQQSYVLGITRLLKPGSTFLLWGLDDRPFGRGALSPGVMEKTFTHGFKLERVETSQLHGRKSRWYWLERQ